MRFKPIRFPPLAGGAVRAGIASIAMGLPAAWIVWAPAAQAQLAVIDPANLIQTALTAARTLQQINNQVKQITNQIKSLENEAKNLAALGTSFAPDMIANLRDLDALIDAAGGAALKVAETRTALETLYKGDYAGSDAATRAGAAIAQIDASRSALRASLLAQAQVSEGLRTDEALLGRLAAASGGATGALSAVQAGNELLAFQAQQSMRLQSLLLAESRAQALERARDMETRAAGRAEHDHFFSRASGASPAPWK